jgi:hypothetical protein
MADEWHHATPTCRAGAGAHCQPRDVARLCQRGGSGRRLRVDTARDDRAAGYQRRAALSGAGCQPAMSSPLDRRLTRLEAATGITATYPTIFVRFGGSDGTDPPASTATIRGRTWCRAEGEGEAAFLGRALAEAGQMDGPAVAILDLEAATNVANV